MGRPPACVTVLPDEVIHIPEFHPQSSGCCCPRASSYVILTGMDWSTWAALGVSVLGAGLAFFGARAGARQQQKANRRAEWRQRFEIALDQLSDAADDRRRTIGHEILRSLATSDLATDEDRALADVVIARDVDGARMARGFPGRLDSMDDQPVDSDNEGGEAEAGGCR